MQTSRQTTYRTIQGDTLDMIAYRIWGLESMARDLADANPEWADTMVFSAGIELVVPDVTVSPKTTNLPPWYGDK